MRPTSARRLRTPPRRRALAIAAAMVASGGALLLAALPAGAHRVGGPAVIHTAGRESFRPDRYALSTLRFLPRTVNVRSGGALRITDGDHSEDPHTVSIVRAKDLPTLRHPDCEICKSIEQAHQPDPAGPVKPIVDVGHPGLDQPGDSVFWTHGHVDVKVSAPAGTTLRYVCAVHAWMQGTIKVTR